MKSKIIDRIQSGNELMIEHPNLDPGVTLHLGNAQEALVAGQLLVSCSNTKMRRMRTFLVIASRWSSR